MDWIKRKFGQRKFWMGATAMIAGLLVIFGKADDVSAADALAENIVGSILTLGGIFGFTMAEAKVDAARAAKDG